MLISFPRIDRRQALRHGRLLIFDHVIRALPPDHPPSHSILCRNDWLMNAPWVATPNSICTSPWRSLGGKWGKSANPRSCRRPVAPDKAEPRDLRPMRGQRCPTRRAHRYPAHLCHASWKRTNTARTPIECGRHCRRNSSLRLYPKYNSRPK